jgi:protease I
MTKNISLLKALLNVEASPSAPRLSSAQLLDAPENKAIQDIWAFSPDNPRLHAGSKIAVLATDGVEEIEINSILHYFRSRGAKLRSCASARGLILFISKGKSSHDWLEDRSRCTCR